MKRQHWVLLHRWVGLVLAAFLLVVGITGSLLAFYRPLDEAFAPHLLKAVRPDGATPLDPLQLRDQLLARHPDLRIDSVPLSAEPGRSMMFRVKPLSDAGGASTDIDEVYVDPFTGRELGGRLWGDPSQGMVNVMPVVYRLHYSLLSGDWGVRLLGIVALVWTLDCFIGAYLTLPPRMPRRDGPLVRQGNGRWTRWRRAWLMRFDGGHRTVVDLHRAGGLWLWAILLVMAWSAVSFNLADVYRPVMTTLLGASDAPKPPLPPSSVDLDTLDWQAARDRGRRLMTTAARAEGIEVRREQSLSLDRTTATWRYTASTDRDIDDRAGHSTVTFDAFGGALRTVQWPTGQAPVETFTNWIEALHTARTGGLALRLLIAATGVAVAVLSVTGVLIWARKSAARGAKTRQRMVEA